MAPEWVEVIAHGQEWITGGSKRPTAKGGVKVKRANGQVFIAPPFAVKAGIELAPPTREQLRAINMPHLGIGRHANVRREQRTPHISRDNLHAIILHAFVNGEVSDEPPTWVHRDGNDYASSRYVNLPGEACAVIVENRHELASDGELVCVTVLDRVGGEIIAHYAERGDREAGKRAEAVVPVLAAA